MEPTRVEDKFDISGFPGEHIDRIWHDVEPLVELALTYASGEYTAMDIYQAIERGAMHLWVASEGTQLKGIIVTYFAYFPRELICQVMLAAGTTVERWEHCLDLIEAWAFQQGVTKMRAYARPGWKRKAREHGYDMQYCIYEKPLRINHAHPH